MLGIFGVQSLPAAELHDMRTNHTSNRLIREEPLKDIEADMPTGSPHRDESTINVVPQGEARACTNGLELPPNSIAAPFVLKHLWSLCSCHCRLGNLLRGRSDRGELQCDSSRTQVGIGFKRSPLAQIRRVGERLPYFFRRVTQYLNENERPVFSVLFYLRSAGRAW